MENPQGMPPIAVAESDSRVQTSKGRQSFRFRIFLRRCHMYLGLFLTPWLTIYAARTVVFNHCSRLQQVIRGACGVDCASAAAAAGIAFADALLGPARANTDGAN